MVLILQLPGYYLRSKGNNKLPAISHWNHTHQKNKLKGNHRKNKQKSDLELKINKPSRNNNFTPQNLRDTNYENSHMNRQCE